MELLGDCADSGGGDGPLEGVSKVTEVFGTREGRSLDPGFTELALGDDGFSFMGLLRALSGEEWIRDVELLAPMVVGIENGDRGL